MPDEMRPAETRADETRPAGTRADETRPFEAGHASFVPVCSIGASAGGVGALQVLFRQLPDDLGLAYVVIVHLAPDHPSSLREILGLCTRMPVLQVQDSPVLRPNCVFVIAPDSELVIEGDNVSARPFTEPRGRRAPIDMFFRSIAAGRGDGVAIVLTGTGSDGALGVRAVKEAGGIVMVQDPGEAEFASMPQSAIATGAADFVVPLARMAERLREVAHSKEAVRSLDVDGAAAHELRRIVAFLRNRTGHDFSSYKRATVMRRVKRRMQVARVDSLPAYAAFLQATPGEARELFSDLLISVTMFFRDPAAFRALEKLAIRPILEDRQDSQTDKGVRVWVAGCATGEEAYSLAILLLEGLGRHKLHVPIQIFATDLDEGALAIAREGRYPRTIEADVSEERLARFFVNEGTHYRVRKEVRETVVFAVHSVLKEPPFMRLDLISCRNLLIYLERSLQQQLYSLFHYGLNEGRFLFLGSAETMESSTDLFSSVDREAHIYAARPRVAQILPILAQFSSPERVAAHRQPPSIVPEHAQVVATLHLGALEQAAPPSVLVDAGHNILNLSPAAGRYLLHSAGPPSSLLAAVVRPELRLDLRLALVRALDQNLSTLTHPVVVAFDGERRRIGLHVAPVGIDGREAAQALVCFLDGDAVDPEAPDASAAEARPEEARRLHAELKAAHEALVASRTGHDVTIQELRAANEELQSANEEYRSAAEELKTSREELQSINEELHTLNAELKSKLERLSVAHDDLQNLTMVMEVGTLFLDAELRIKMFTPPITDIFNVTQFDIGRAVTDFTNRLDHPPLVDEARQVLRTLEPIEREVPALSGSFYVMRMRPYRTTENRIEGVVVTFVDISARLRMERALSRSEQQFRALIRASSQVLYRMNADWTEMRELFGGGFLSHTDAPTQGWLEHYIPAEDRAGVRVVIDRAIETRSVFELEHRVLREDGSVGWTQSRAIPILDGNGGIADWFGSAEDVTLSHRAQDALRESEDRLRVLVEGVPQLVWRSDGGGHLTWSSPQWHRYTGLSELESRGSGWMTAVHPDDRGQFMTAWYEGATAHFFEVECRVRHVDKPDYHWFRGRATPILDAQGRVAEWLGTFTDVNDLRTLQGRQEVLLAELQHRVRNIMAVIRSIAARTAENCTDVGDYAARLRGRLEAFARTQVLLTREAGVGVDLGTMVRDELLTQTAEAGQLDIEGPEVRLSAKATEVLTLAVHELATNAVKYGALSGAGGVVRVRWEMDPADPESLLTFRWTESGLDLGSQAPRRRGFGTELVEQRVPYELSGFGRLDILPDGVEAVIAFPLRRGDSILQTGVGSVRLPHEGFP